MIVYLLWDCRDWKTKNIYLAFTNKEKAFEAQTIAGSNFYIQAIDIIE